MREIGFNKLDMKTFQKQKILHLLPNKPLQHMLNFMLKTPGKCYYYSYYDWTRFNTAVLVKGVLRVWQENSSVLFGHQWPQTIQGLVVQHPEKDGFCLQEGPGIISLAQELEEREPLNISRWWKMRAWDTISLLIRRGGSGFACDKTQVINILWVGADWASSSLPSLLCRWYVGRICASSNRYSVEKTERGEDGERRAIWKMEAQSYYTL